MTRQNRDSRKRPPAEVPDAASPYVLGVHQLGRRPGASMQFQRTVPAGESWQTPVMAIPSGSDVELDLLAESVIEGVLLSGVARTQSVGECSRCLEPVTEPVVAEVGELCLWEDRAEVEAEEGELDEEPILVVEDRIDIADAVRDSLLLALPLVPLCSPDCPGLCAQCGVRLADHPEHRHEVLDPRWSALEALRDTGTRDGGDAGD